jgi:hypothetical protein
LWLSHNGNQPEHLLGDAANIHIGLHVARFRRPKIKMQVVLADSALWRSLDI